LKRRNNQTSHYRRQLHSRCSGWAWEPYPWVLQSSLLSLFFLKGKYQEVCCWFLSWSESRH